MRITKTLVEELGREAAERSGRIVLEGINSPGDGATRYCMSESSVSVYKTARVAAAYLLGVLAGLDPDGLVHWTANRPPWIEAIDDEYKFGQIGPKALAAYRAGTEYGRTHRRPALEAQPMKAGELGRFVCVSRNGCLHSPCITIRSDGVWVRSPDPDPLNPGSHLYSSAHRDCYEAWAARVTAGLLS